MATVNERMVGSVRGDNSPKLNALTLLCSEPFVPQCCKGAKFGQTTYAEVALCVVIGPWAEHPLGDVDIG
jgi:hypothetical protein